MTIAVQGPTQMAVTERRRKTSRTEKNFNSGVRSRGVQTLLTSTPAQTVVYHSAQHNCVDKRMFGVDLPAGIRACSGTLRSHDSVAFAWKPPGRRCCCWLGLRLRHLASSDGKEPSVFDSAGC